MKPRQILIGALCVVVAAALVGWWFHTFEQVAKEIDLPMRGEARYNSLFALKKTLQAQGHSVVARSSLNLKALTQHSDATLILAADVRTLATAQVEELMEWVEGGGQLVFALPSGTEGRGGELLEYLGLEVDRHSSCLVWTAEPAADGGRHCFRYRFRVDSEDFEQFDWLWGSKKHGYVFGRRSWGEGSWSVAANLEFLKNRELDKAGHAALAWQVLGPALGTGKVHLVYSANVLPWYVLIVRHGWPLLLPLLLALFAWLWARSQRLGPLLPVAARDRRALLEHVHASGEFAYRRGRSIALYSALRRAYMERLKRRDPAQAALKGDALVDALAAQHQLPAAAIQQALNPIDLGRPDYFFATIKTLLQLGKKP